MKKTYIGERANLEFRMQALNAFNLTNFLLFAPGNGITTTLGANGTGFGQTTGRLPGSVEHQRSRRPHHRVQCCG